MSIGKNTPTAKLTGPALEARRAYQRKWYANNAEKRREYMARYWERRAEREAEQAENPQKSAEIGRKQGKR